MKKFVIAAAAGSALAFRRPRTRSRRSASISATHFPNSLTLIGEAPGKLAQKLEPPVGGHDRPARERARRAGPGAAGDPGHRPGLGRRRLVERRLLRQHRLGVQHVRRGAVRPRHPGIPRLGPPRRRPAALARDVRQARRLQHPVRHHPARGLGLVPARDQDGRGPEGPEDALLRPGRARHEQARRRDAAARARRHLPGAAARHHRRHRVLAAGDGPEARLPPGGEVLLLPRLAPAGHVPRVLHQRATSGRGCPTSTRR